ncbi:MAG: DUF2199 domain-containing protein [Methylococcaceae bacterium]|nr:DUF2199 domain-containing protein [Methylococcaceae bacterium]
MKSKSSNIFSFKCSCCGELHEGSPSFAFPAPTYVNQLPESEKDNIIESGEDLFKVKDGDNIHHFIRACLEVPILGCDEPFIWGIWVSLSAQNFNRYVTGWDDVDESDSYFGWFSSKLPYYDDTLSLKAQVRPRKNGIRPYLEIEQDGHELANDLNTYISIEKAQRIAEFCMHPK